MKTDIFYDTSCPACGCSNLERVDILETEEAVGWWVLCENCKAEFFILTHVFGWFRVPQRKER